MRHRPVHRLRRHRGRAASCAGPGPRRRHGHRPGRRGLRPGQRRRGLRRRPLRSGPARFAGTIDVVVAVVPYVPTSALAPPPPRPCAPRTPAHYHGGPDGTDLLRRVDRGRTERSCARAVRSCSSWAATRPSWSGPCWTVTASATVEVWADEDGDVRGIEATAVLGRLVMRAGADSGERTPRRPSDAVDHVPARVVGEVERQRCVRRPHHVGDVVRREDRVGIGGQVVTAKNSVSTLPSKRSVRPSTNVARCRAME